MKKATSALLALAALVARADLDYLNYAVGQDPAAVTVTFASTADSRGFTWFTTQDVASGEVAVLPGSFGSGDDAAFDASPRRVAAAVVAADDDGRPINVFTARVYGLPAGGYSFRLGSAGHYRYGTFTVRAKPSEVTIVNLSDAQTRDATRLWKWERSCQAVASTVAPGAIDFIVNGGDHFDGAFLDAGDNTIPANQSGHCRYFQWAIATDAMNQFLSDVPVLWTSGNHDYYKGYEFTAEDWAVTNASTYGCHSFDYGPVHFASIPWPSSKNNVDRDTVSWLEADLGAVKRRSDIKWRIVSMHAGPYTTGDNTRDEAYTNVVAKISAICSQHNVDLVLQAHDHTYSKTLPYRWDAAGFTTSETDGAVVNLSPVRAELDGEVWDVDPNGTYYVCDGCAGHRVGELMEYADRNGASSYTQRIYKVVTSTISVDSAYASKGDDASKDVGRTMFAVLRVDGNRLRYDWYTVGNSGEAALFDTLRVMKSTGGDVRLSNATDFSRIPAEQACLDPLADDDGARPTTSRYWSFDGADTTVLPFCGEAGSRYLAMATGGAMLSRNFNALSSSDPMSAEGRSVVLVTNSTAYAEATVRFTAASVVPTCDEGAAGNKIVLFAHGGSLCALGGHVDVAEGLVQTLYTFNLATDSEWLAATHRVRLDTYAEATSDGRHAGVVVSVDGVALSVAGAGAGYLGAVSIAPQLAQKYEARQLILSLQEGVKGRGLTGLAFSGTGDLHDVRLSYERTDLTARKGLVIIIR